MWTQDNKRHLAPGSQPRIGRAFHVAVERPGAAPVALDFRLSTSRPQPSLVLEMPTAILSSFSPFLIQNMQ